MANVIKSESSVRTRKEPRLGKMGREALELRIGKCYKENVAYFSEDWEGVQIEENGPEGTGAQNWQML